MGSVGMGRLLWPLAGSGFGAAEEPLGLVSFEGAAGAAGAGAGVPGVFTVLVVGVRTPMLARVAASSPLTGVVPITLMSPAQIKTTASASLRRKGTPQGLHFVHAMMVLRMDNEGPLSGPG